MDIVICKTPEKAQSLVAKIMVDRILANPNIVLGLATGRTMEGVYEKLLTHQLSFSNITTFNLDEYVGLERSDPQSYHSYMFEKLFDRTNIDPKNVHLPDGNALNLKEAARDYEARIRLAGGIDLQLLGIGRSGHIGFNEPLSSLSSRTRDKMLTTLTREQNASVFGGDINAVPTHAVTMGVGTISEAREIILLATGQEKAKILSTALEGPISSTVTASAIQTHPNCKVITDEAASSALLHHEYFREAARRDPDWASYQKWIN